MNKREMKIATDKDLITEYVRTCVDFGQNFVLDRGTLVIHRHLKALEAEILKRGILDQRHIDRISL